MEKWIDVSGYEGLYSVSDLGRIRSEDRVIPHSYSGANRLAGKVLKPYLNNMGYPMVTLCSPGKKKKFLVHVVVLTNFVGPRPTDYDGCHNNGQPSDSRLENLRWDTKSANSQDRKKHGTSMCGAKCSSAKITEEQAKEIKRDPRVQRLIALDYGIGQMQVSRIKSGARWAHLEE